MNVSTLASARMNDTESGGKPDLSAKTDSRDGDDRALAASGSDVARGGGTSVDPADPTHLREVARQVRAAFPRPLRGPELVLIDVDPRRLHAFWTVTPSAVDAAREGLGAAPMVLRVAESASGDETGAAFDVEVVGVQGQCYVDVWGDARRYRGSIGIRTEDGDLVELARSAAVTLPRPAPAEERPSAISAAAVATVEDVPAVPAAEDAPPPPPEEHSAAMAPLAPSTEPMSARSLASDIASPADQPAAAVPLSVTLPPVAVPVPPCQPTVPPPIEIRGFVVHGVPPAFVPATSEPADAPPRPGADEAHPPLPTEPSFQDWLQRVVDEAAPVAATHDLEAEPHAPTPVVELPEPVHHPFPLPPTTSGDYDPQSLLGGFLPPDAPQPEPWRGDGEQSVEPSEGEPPHDAQADAGAPDPAPTPSEEAAPPAPAGVLPLENVLALSSYALGRERVEFEINAELHIFGRARVGTDLSLFGRKVTLRPDGTFSITRPLPSGALVLSSLLVGDDSAE